MVIKMDKKQLEMLIKGTRPEEIDENLLPTSIKITENALAKAKKIGELVDKKATSSYEWYSFSLASKNNDYIVRDIILPKKQKISSAHCAVSGEEVALASNEVAEINRSSGKDYYIIGWLHSHANFSPFHSPTDHENIMNVLNSVSLNTEKVTYKPFDLIESEATVENRDGKIVMRGMDEEDGIFELNINDIIIENLLKKYNLKELPEGKEKIRGLVKDVFSPEQMKFKEPVIKGFCYSVVINNIGATPDTLMAVIEEEIISHKKNVYEKKIPLEVIKAQNDITLNDEELQKLVDERIEIPKFFFGIGFRRKKRGVVKSVTTREYEYGAYDWGNADYGKESDITVGFENKKGSDKINPKKLVDKFIDELFHYTYTRSHEDYSAFLDEIITGVIKTGDIEESLLKGGQAYKTSWKEDFNPMLLDAYKNKTKEIFLSYINRKSESSKALYNLMINFVGESTIYNKEKIIENIDEVIESLNVKKILKEDTEKNRKTKKDVGKINQRSREPRNKSDLQ